METISNKLIKEGMKESLELNNKKSILSLEDMTNLISIYDSIRQLKKVLLGNMGEHWEDGGALRLFEYVFDIIENATCVEIQRLGEDEACKKVATILNNDMVMPKERAKQLLGLTEFV